MKTAIQIFLKQTRRSTKRLVLQLVLLCAATSFFVVSLNLYQNSMQNLQTVEDTYSTIAAVEFYGNVDNRGNLVSPSDETSVGYHLLNARGFDLSPLLELDAVTDYDLRYRCGAYIPGATPVAWEQLSGDDIIPLKEDEMSLMQTRDILRFTLDSNEPVQLQFTVTEQGPRALTRYRIPIQVIDNARKDLTYPSSIYLGIDDWRRQADADWYAQDIRRLNRSDESMAVTLYPGVEYVISGYLDKNFWVQNPETGKYEWSRDVWYLYDTCMLRLYVNSADLPFVTDYTEYSEYGEENAGGTDLGVEAQQPFYIQRWEDIQANAEEAAYWQAVWDAVVISGNAFSVTVSNDLESVPAWYMGAMYLQEGRMITAEEYASGEKVCMVSAALADYMNWAVGDKLDMSLFRTLSRTDNVGTQPIVSIHYLLECGGFFDRNTYEIVGIYGQRDFTEFGYTLPETFYQPWNTICIPEQSAPNGIAEAQRDIRPSTLSLQLKNGSISEFKQAVEELGLTEQKAGQYQLKFSYFDQGYDKIKPGLDEMHRNAKLLLGLSAALLAVTMVLTAFLFAQQHKHSAGILRMLGGSKKQAFTAILTCAAAVVAAGGISGTALGGALTQSVGASTLGDAAESAKVALSTGASPVLTALSGLGCMVLFLLLTAAFTATYIGKEPRALLPQDKG